MSTPNAISGMRTRHWIFGIGLPAQAGVLATIQTFGHLVCGTGLFDNPITWTTGLTALIGVIDYFKNTGKN